MEGGLVTIIRCIEMLDILRLADVDTESCKINPFLTLHCPHQTLSSKSPEIQPVHRPSKVSSP